MFAAIAAGITVMFVAIALATVVGFYVGNIFGSAHQDANRRLAFEEGYQKGLKEGNDGRVGLLGVPFGERCEVWGRLSFPLRNTKRGSEDGVYTLETWDVNGKHFYVSINVIFEKPEEAKRVMDEGYGHFFGYETLEAHGIPAWLNDGNLCATDYFIENRFVITNAE